MAFLLLLGLLRKALVLIHTHALACTHSHTLFKPLHSPWSAHVRAHTHTASLPYQSVSLSLFAAANPYFGNFYQYDFSIALTHSHWYTHSRFSVSFYLELTLSLSISASLWVWVTSTPALTHTHLVELSLSKRHERTHTLSHSWTHAHAHSVGKTFPLYFSFSLASKASSV